MTKPTQAQIEAVRLSEENLHSIGHARYLVERATPDNPEVCFDYELVGDLLNIIDRLTAAAEVGENRHPAYAYAMGAKMEEIEEATIERCAQVAKEIIIYLLDLHEDELTRQQRSFIVDQFERKFVAALKDKP